MSNTTTDQAAERRPGSAMRRLDPKCKPPTGVVMRKLSANQAQRLRLRLTERLECIYDPRFARAGAERQFAPPIDQAASREPRPIGSRLSPHARRTKALSREEEAELFLRFNFGRYRMMRILRAHAGKRLSAAATRELLKWDRVVLDVRDEIVQANLGLVPAMVERSRLTGVDFAELISEGQLALLRSVDKFDCSRGFKFSTYACRAILTSITRAVAMMARHRARFPTEYDPALQKGDFIESQRAEIEASCEQELRAILKSNLAELTATEREVLSERFGMKHAGRKTNRDSKTLRQVAEVFGVTKERVRQIQNRALAKLRVVLDEQVFAGQES